MSSKGHIAWKSRLHYVRKKSKWPIIGLMIWRGENKMEQILNYVKPELLVLTVVLYFVGVFIKKTEGIKDKYIPAILGITGIVICAVYVFATCSCSNPQEIAMAVFTAVTQGILVAGLSTYVNQLIKQTGKED
nr:MAG TPA: holin [Caudoviricetes sp.]